MGFSPTVALHHKATAPKRVLQFPVMQHFISQSTSFAALYASGVLTIFGGFPAIWQHR